MSKKIDINIDRIFFLPTDLAKYLKVSDSLITYWRNGKRSIPKRLGWDLYNYIENKISKLKRFNKKLSEEMKGIKKT